MLNKKIGFIGLGKMGLPMASRLAEANLDLIVTSSNPDSLATMAKLGAKTAANVQELIGICDVLITILPADKEVMELFTSAGTGILYLRDRPLTCIEMTSVQGDTMRKLASAAESRNKDIVFLDAPVSGGVAGATAGTLTIMCGGNRETFAACSPLLEIMGKKLIFTGALGSGSDVKMLNQVLNAAHTEIASEVIALARALDIDPQVLCDVVNESSGGSWIFKNNVPKYIIPRQHNPGFRLGLMKKDISLVIDTARSKQMFMPVANLVYQLFNAAANQGKDDMNYTWIAEWLAENQPKE